VSAPEPISAAMPEGDFPRLQGCDRDRTALTLPRG